MPKLIAYTWKGCKKILRKNKLKAGEFSKWMNGQTGLMLPSGGFGVYPWDLERYIKWKKGGKVPIWD